MRRSILPTPSQDALSRAERFSARKAKWRSLGRPVPHSEAEALAPAVLSVIFARAVRIVSPMREYAYRTERGQSVRLCVDNWHWHCLDGTAEGRGLYELWAWAFDVPVSRAAYEIRHTLADIGGQAPE